ncbi:MAG: ribbon-helix-helix protein, CopG family [Desulfosalsimonas sp.]|uniref:ribbon-helix-helix protein, CopG family n=1 Tax=Desulfosalsimonas sp. TaxID=3073848 RepID=UPI003970BDE4
MNTQMIIRVDPALKSKVNNLARAEGKNTSQLVRELLEAYVQDRDIELYINDLWQRVGNKLKAQGIGANDIDQAIEDVRAGKS